jgi:hypothetical protein
LTGYCCICIREFCTTLRVNRFLNQRFKSISIVLGTKFNLKTGAVAEDEWCTSPIGKIVGGLFEPAGVPVYSCKTKGNVVEVQVDVNYKAAFESKYWTGILDAQGKSNGKYY